MAVPLGVDDVLFEELLVEGGSLILHSAQVGILKHILGQVLLDLFVLFGLLVIELAKRMAAHMRIDNEGGQLVVYLFLNFVTDDREQVET